MAVPPVKGVTESQEGSTLVVLSTVNGVPLLAGDVTLTVCDGPGVYDDPLLVQVMKTELGEGASAEPELVMFKVAFTVRSVPVEGVKVSTTTWPLVAPLQPAATLKAKLVATLVEPTDKTAGLGSTTGPAGAVTVTLTALPATASVMPTAAGVGPRTVSQLSVSAVGFATSVAA